MKDLKITEIIPAKDVFQEEMANIMGGSAADKVNVCLLGCHSGCRTGGQDPTPSTPTPSTPIPTPTPTPTPSPDPVSE